MGVMDTDPQVLTNLQEIRSLLQALVTIGIVIAAAVVIRVLLVMYSTWRQIQKKGSRTRRRPCTGTANWTIWSRLVMNGPPSIPQIPIRTTTSASWSSIEATMR